MNNEEMSSAIPVGSVAPTQREPRPEEDSLRSVIRSLRQQLGMTQEELAQALGITVGTVSRWEKGRFRPSRLARALIVEFARSHDVPVNLKVGGRPALNP